MCCLVLHAWQNFVTPAYSCSRQLYTLCRYSRPHMLACQSAKHLSNVYRQTSHYVKPLLHSSSLSTSSNYEFPCRWPRGWCLSVVHQPEVLTVSRSLRSSSVIYPAVKTVEHRNHSRLNFCRSRHFMPRHLAPSTKTIIDASPLSLQPYLRLIRFDRPIGTWLLFLPCTWSISLSAPAGQLPDLSMLALFALGSFSMRAAACTINDMLDKNYDAQVARTRDRPLVCGEISQFRALTFLALPLSVSLGVLLTFNWNTVALGAVSVVPCIIYPLMKRITYWPQAFLGITLNWGVMIAWSAIHGSLTPAGFVLYLSCVLWTMIYDTIYSHQDKADDMHVGVKSLALKLGSQSKLWLAGFATGVTSGLAISGVMCDQPWLYFAGVGVVGSHFAYQIRSVNLSDPVSCGSTFRSNRNLGLIFWAFIVAAGLMSGDEKKQLKGKTEYETD